MLCPRCTASQDATQTSIEVASAAPIDHNRHPSLDGHSIALLYVQQVCTTRVAAIVSRLPTQTAH